MVPPPELLLAWLAAVARVVALCVTAPVLGHAAVPVRLRAALAVAIATALAPLLPPPTLPAASSAVPLVALAVGELAIGALLGFAARLVFDAIGLLGGFASIQGGLGAASVLDPASHSSTLAFAAVLESVAVLLWLAIGGPEALLRALWSSFEAMPLGGGPPPAASFLALAALGADVFRIAVQLAAPVTVAMLLANLLLGFLGRALPEVNLMALQLPAHVVLLLALLWLGAGAFGDAMVEVLAAWQQRLGALIGGA